MTSGPRHRGAKPAGFAGFACEGLQAIATARLAGYRYIQACRLSLQAGLQAIATARLAGYRYSQACRLSLQPGLQAIAKACFAGFACKPSQARQACEACRLVRSQPPVAVYQNRPPELYVNCVRLGRCGPPVARATENPSPLLYPSQFPTQALPS